MRTEPSIFKDIATALQSTSSTTVPASPAAAAVFNTYELIENILLHVPSCDILFATAINKSVFEVVERSMSIYKRLCFDLKHPFNSSPTEEVSHFVNLYFCHTATLLVRRLGESEIIAILNRSRLREWTVKVLPTGTLLTTFKRRHTNVAAGQSLTVGMFN
jgi:hypothetical protein